MTIQQYNWTRYWYASDTTINLHNGLLAYPTLANEHVVTLEQLTDVSCIFLLAEPGMGKSSALEQEYERLSELCKSTNDTVLRFDLRNYSSEDRLIRDIFQNPSIKEWENGTHNLYMLLDSLDEGIIKISTIVSILADELYKYKTIADRLFVRIACRTFDFQPSLEESLKQIWKQEDVRKYQLAPLQLLDIINALDVSHLDKNEFLDQLQCLNVQPLASRPVTLEMLLSAFKKHQTLANNQKDLYYNGCLHLCTETNAKRREQKNVGELLPQHRLEIAGQIACAMLFAHKSAIYMGIDQSEIVKEDLTIPDIVFKTNYTQSLLDETLGTSLFIASGQHRLSFAHQSYAEFLAAWYLHTQKTPINQVTRLIFSSLNDKKVIPQLREVAAWLTSFQPAIGKEIIKRDPHILLRSDTARLDDSFRAQLVDGLLQAYENEQLFDRNYPRFYTPLDHPEITTQLRRYINDTQNNLLTRLSAVDMAEGCKTNELTNDLVAIALDDAENQILRVACASAIVAIDDEQAKSHLKPLLGLSSDLDPDLQLRGYALQATFPHHVTAQDVFAVLKPEPESENYIYGGSYDRFLRNHLLQNLKIDDFPIALNWISTLPRRYDLSRMFLGIINQIFVNSWEHIDKSEFLQAFTLASLSRIQYYESIVSDKDIFGHDTSQEFQQMISADYTKRRILFLSLIKDSNIEAFSQIFWHSKLINSQDLPWIVNQIISSESQDMRDKLLELLNNRYI